MGRIDVVYDTMSDIISKSTTVTAIAAAQIISNVPTALLMSAFTDNGRSLVIGTNLGGLGTLIASMASLITYKYHAALPPVKEKSVNYIAAFSVINIMFLVILLSLYFVFRRFVYC